MFYTPSTITISEGQKIRGKLVCGPNAKNNRDLDITISYKTGETTGTVEYKMCVVFPLLCAGPPRFVNPTDRWVGADCIFMFNLSRCVILARSNSHAVACTCCPMIFFLVGATSTQVLINRPTYTSPEYHVVDVVHRNAHCVSFGRVQAGAATAKNGLAGNCRPSIGTEPAQSTR